MNKNIKLLFSGIVLLAGISLFSPGCKLDEPIFPKTDTTGTKPTVPTDPNTPTVPVTSDSYQPVTKGSYWKYKNVVTGGSETEIHTMTGATATFSNKPYYEVSVESSLVGTNSAYYYHGDGNYILRGAGLQTGVYFEYTYLKDNYDVGKTWTANLTDNGTVNSVPAQVVGKIIEQGMTKTVLGKTYANVIHTQVLIQYDMGSGFETIQTQDYYIAKGIGFIELDSFTSTFGVTVSTTALLTEYSIK